MIVPSIASRNYRDSRLMDKPNTVKDSTKFPPGYGDFALQCSDGVVCHFPRYLLGYLSGFFKGMFELPQSNGNVQSTNPLPLTEPSETIELLLQHMDPKMTALKLEKGTIVDLLEVARKYQVPTVTTWIQEEIQVKKVYVLSQNHGSSLLLKSPLLILYCALRFDLPNLGRLALKILARCDTAFLKSSNPAIELRHYLYVMSLRKRRIELFTSFVRELTVLKPREIPQPFHPYVITKLDASRVVCATCASARASWAFALQCAVNQEPSWDSFLRAYETNVGTSTCLNCKTTSWADYYREFLNRWKPEANRIEKELPEWPDWFS